jgi:hypothetical protein
VTPSAIEMLIRLADAGSRGEGDFTSADDVAALNKIIAASAAALASGVGGDVEAGDEDEDDDDDDDDARMTLTEICKMILSPDELERLSGSLAKSADTIGASRPC